jgi:hypothetical protein
MAFKMKGFPMMGEPYKKTETIRKDLDPNFEMNTEKKKVSVGELKKELFNLDNPSGQRGKDLIKQIKEQDPSFSIEDQNFDEVD